MGLNTVKPVYNNTAECRDQTKYPYTQIMAIRRSKVIARFKIQNKIIAFVLKLMI